MKIMVMIMTIVGQVKMVLMRKMIMILMLVMKM